MVLGTLWAGMLVVGGLWMAFDAPGHWPRAAPACVAGAVASVAAGQFIFMYLAADRLFPEAGRRFGWIAELVTLGVFVGAALTAAAGL